jgi:hypothetical protein
MFWFSAKHSHCLTHEVDTELARKNKMQRQSDSMVLDNDREDEDAGELGDSEFPEGDTNFDEFEDDYGNASIVAGGSDDEMNMNASLMSFSDHC